MRRLTKNHPTYKKVEKLFILMDELNISLDIVSHNRILVLDGDALIDKDPLCAELQDLESKQACTDLPPICEYKLVIE